MSDADTVEMDPDERDAFLGDGGTGVVSFQTAGRDPPYSLPVSYGYDRTAGRFYFRLAFPTDSGKESGLTDRPVSFVVYGQRGDEWQSVVATGRLTAVDEADVDASVLDGMSRIHIPLYDVFDADRREIPFRFVYLDPDELTARREHSRGE
jgi:nitroimidazol reductase NimA-like FMN-containing flavoprotein (pyridoxamine 5'-phosphate oxidase superfamily)